MKGDPDAVSLHQRQEGARGERSLEVQLSVAGRSPLTQPRHPLLEGGHGSMASELQDACIQEAVSTRSRAVRRHIRCGPRRTLSAVRTSKQRLLPDITVPNDGNHTSHPSRRGAMEERCVPAVAFASLSRSFASAGHWERRPPCAQHDPTTARPTPPRARCAVLLRGAADALRAAAAAPAPRTGNSAELCARNTNEHSDRKLRTRAWRDAGACGVWGGR